MSVPRKDQNFLCHMLWSFVCSMIWGERWLLIFVDIGGIVDHHCSNFLFINFLLFNLPWVTMNHTALTEHHIKKENIYDLLMKIRSVIATWQFYVNACYTKKRRGILFLGQIIENVPYLESINCCINTFFTLIQYLAWT